MRLTLPLWTSLGLHTLCATMICSAYLLSVESAWKAHLLFVVVVVVVVVLTLTHNPIQSVVAGQAPITLEWKKYPGSKTEAKTKKQAYALHDCGHQGSKKETINNRQKHKKEDEAKQK